MPSIDFLNGIAFGYESNRYNFNIIMIFKFCMSVVHERTIRTSDRRLSAKLVPTFAVRSCRVLSATDPDGRILGASKPEPLLICTHEAEWTQFQTHYLSKDLVGQEIEPGPLYL
jgi:hypothetical protein